MGSKRKKVKDILSPPKKSPPPVPAGEDDELLDDLISQLDSKNNTVRNVSAEVINDIQLSQLQESEEPQKQKKDSKTRFLERQVCMFPPVPKTKIRHRLGAESRRLCSTLLSRQPSGGRPDRKRDKGRGRNHQQDMQTFGPRIAQRLHTFSHVAR